MPKETLWVPIVQGSALKGHVNYMKKTIIFSLFLSLALYSFILPPVQAAKCTAEKPDHAPDLFQIDVTKNSAKLHFTPINNAITNYTIAYGYARREDRFVVSFPFGRYDGVINYTVNDLSPNTKYYLRVRADNGCRYGYWSDTMSVETNWENKTYTRVKGDSGGSNFFNPAAGFAPDVPEVTATEEATPESNGVQEEIGKEEKKEYLKTLAPTKIALGFGVIGLIIAFYLWRRNKK